MTSSYTTRNRLNKQGTGDNTNTWGDTLNTGALDLADFALDGWTTKALTADVTLTSANGTTDEARARCLKLTGSASWTVTLPAVEKFYMVWNASSATQTIASAGGGASVTLLAGEIVPIMTDATLVKRLTMLSAGSNRIQNVTDPTSAQDAATKAYADALAFTANAGVLPGQTGNSGKYLTTDGTTASWDAVDAANITSFSAAASAVRTGTTTTSALTPGDTYAGLAEVTVTSSSNSVALDMSTFVNAYHDLTENTTLANPTNPKVGQVGWIRVRQHASSAKTCATGSNWYRVGGDVAVSATLSSYNIFQYQVIASDFILYDVFINPTNT